VISFAAVHFKLQAVCRIAKNNSENRRAPNTGFPYLHPFPNIVLQIN